MNNNITNIARRLAYAGVGLVITLCTATAAAQPDKPLKLAQTPLFTASNVPPNVLVAVDNSGSMDFETLFDTRDGALYWKTNDTNFLRETLQTIGGLLGLDKDKDGSFWNAKKGRFVQATGQEYVYLFPNGFNDTNHDDRRVYNPDNDENQTLLEGLLTPLGLGDLGSLLGGINAPLNLDQLISDLTLDQLNKTLDYVGLLDWYQKFFNHYSVPPIPDLAFARSPKYNHAYFDPKQTYKPWIGYSPATPSAAWYDPAEKDGNLNLTENVRKKNDGYRFDVRRGMDLSESTYYVDNCLLQLFGSCVLGRQAWVSPKDRRGLLKKLGNKIATFVFGERKGSLAIEYYPATFYLKAAPGASIADCKAQLPTTPINYVDQIKVLTHEVKDGFLSWHKEAELGRDREGNLTMCGFEIKDTGDRRAIQNFANWFTYYRKRHLAVRGGLTSALDSVGGLRFGYMPISNAIDGEADLSMTDVDYDSDRSSLYNGIYDIDFSRPRGTPNREALNFLRMQLEDNTGIVQKACQRNLSMVFTDGYNTGTVSDIGNADENYSPIYDDGKADTIADIAMSGYTDLSTNFSEQEIQDNPVPVPSSCNAENPDPRLDCNTQPHMVTSGVTLGQRGTVYDPEQQSTLENSVFGGNPPWRDFDPNKLGRTQIDDLWHATINGRGDMLNATTPADIADSFKGILADILTNSGSGSDIGVESGYLGDESVAYRASFTSGAWSGGLSALPIGADDARLGPEPVWGAARQLTDRDPGDRVILTTVGHSAKAFQWSALKNTGTLQDKAQVDYIRGDQSNELANGGTYRNRGDNILGDIVHSTPVYVGTPDRVRYPADWNDRRQDGNETTPEDAATKNYRQFANQHSERHGMIYVGANDGMLHGFDADTGDETLAYVPNGVLDNLAALADPNYSHRYYVDGTPVAGDVVYGGAWHTVLVGGLRAGGRSVYALDITDPGEFSEDTPGKTVLWEFTDNNLGYTYGTPSIVRLHNGTWAALFGNGYNSDDQSARLFAVQLSDSGKDKSNPNFWQVPAVPAASGNDDKPNGLSQVFPVDVDGDFITDYVYAGDLQGNLWRFDLTDINPGNWAATKIFTAKDSSGNVQPITTQPQVGPHPYGLNYGVMVYFGTGKYLEKSDRNLTPQNTFYGIWDPGVFTADTIDIDGAASRSNLFNQKVALEQGSRDKTYRAVSAVSDKPIDYTPDSETSAASFDRGWLLDLPAGGERVVSNAQLQEGARGTNYTVAFSTLTPGTPTACGAAGGGYFMVLNQLDGGRTEQPVFDLNGDNMFNPTGDSLTADDGADVAASGVRLDGGIPGRATHQSDRTNDKAFYIIPTTDGSTTTINIPLLGKDGRVSWREIRQ